MKRVVILGPGASGKSTLAIHLSDIMGLPAIELDKIFWQPGLVATPRAQWIKLQERLVEEDGWIIDGDLGPYHAVEVRLQAADPSFSWTSQSSDVRSRPFLLEMIAKYGGHATLHVIRKPEALRRFVTDARRNREAAEPSADK